MSRAPALAPDAAIVLGIASTAMPFARTREEAVERWLRVLRSTGKAGAVLRALGVSEGAVEISEEALGAGEGSIEGSEGAAGAGEDSIEGSEGAAGVSEGPLHASGEAGDRQQGGSVDVDRREAPSDAVAQVAERAAQIALERRVSGIATTDLLMAVMCVYGPDFDRVLRAHGTDRDELIARLAAN
jgi:hypothetical protein